MATGVGRPTELLKLCGSLHHRQTEKPPGLFGGPEKPSIVFLLDVMPVFIPVCVCVRGLTEPAICSGYLESSILSSALSGISEV